MDRNTNPGSTTLTFPVALRKESVDRNERDQLQNSGNSQSLSARRAWIEIGLSFARKIRYVGRSPQGERG